MCRQSQTNKYKKCYLKKPRLYTIPEEDHVTIHDIHVSGNKHSSSPAKESPKGIKRIVSNSYTGNMSPRCSERKVKDKKRNILVPYTPEGGQNNNSPRLAKRLVVDFSDIGNQSPQSRRSTTNRKSQASTVKKGSMFTKVDDIVVDVADLNCSGSPKVIKRLMVASKLGNQSPPCRRTVVKENETKKQAINLDSSKNKGSKNSMVKATGNKEWTGSSDWTGSKDLIGSQEWSGSQSSGLNIKGKKLIREKSLFKRMVKFLTVPPKEDFICS